MSSLGRFKALGQACAGLIALTACGGGGGSVATTPPDFHPTAVASIPSSSGLPADWQQGVFAEIFVRAYQDSNGDGIGDLDGLVSRLDYLQALGVSGIWLMPIHPSQDGDHGYAVNDYRGVSADYGDLAALRRLIEEAHQRGIGVVLDYVINHSAAQHPAFQNAAQGSSNRWRDWYLWQPTRPAGWSIYGGDPWRWSASGYYFAGFADSMPDFNLRNEEVLTWHEDNLRYWLNLGVDGFRFDAVGHLVENGPSAWENQAENHAVLDRMRQVIAQYDQRFLVCEAPSLPQAYATSTSCGHAFAFGYQYDLSSAVRGDVNALDRVVDYWRDAQGLVGFASNHDAFAGKRIADQLNENADQMRLLAATYLLQAHSPFIYYGEEIGMRGASALQGDPALRVTMSWTADARRAGFTDGVPFRALSANVQTANVQSQEHDPTSMLNFYRQVIALRQASSALRGGDYRSLVRQGLSWGFVRSDARETALVLYNYGASTHDYAVTGLRPDAVWETLWPASSGQEVSDAQGQMQLRVEAESFRVLILRHSPEGT